MLPTHAATEVIQRPLSKRQQAIKNVLIIIIAILFVSTVACQVEVRRSAGSTNTNPNDNQVVADKTVNQTGQPIGNLEGNKPSIKITEVPPEGAGKTRIENIGGVVSGVNVQECKVIIFARTEKWYVEPFVAAPNTVIGDDGTWKNETHLGSEYAALLVKNDYRPPNTTKTLPGIGDLVLAIDKVAAKKEKPGAARSNKR